LTGIQEVADHELQRMWPCWWNYVQWGCATDTSGNTWNFHQSSVGCNIYDHIRATYLEEKNMPIWLLKYSGSVATHLRW